MINVNIVCVGNLKEKFSREEQAEYQKRLSAFCNLNIVEIKEQNQLENKATILEKEGQDIVKKLKGYVILCDINSKEITSEKFAEKIENLSISNSTITFVIGSSYGLSQKIKKNNTLLSVSKMTLPHHLMRIFLEEQIYRAFNILNNTSYHK